MARGLAAKLAMLFGNVEGMSALYAEDIFWTVPRSLRYLAGTYRGISEVVRFNHQINTTYNANSMRIDILDDLVQGDVSAARFPSPAGPSACAARQPLNFTIAVPSADLTVRSPLELPLWAPSSGFAKRHTATPGKQRRRRKLLPRSPLLVLL